MNANGFIYGLVWRTAYLYYSVKYRIFQDYLVRVNVQAYQLYKGSSLFKLRWQEMSLKFAEDSYEQDRHFFIDKVKKGPRLIRLRLFRDFMTGAPYNAYFIRD